MFAPSPRHSGRAGTAYYAPTKANSTAARFAASERWRARVGASGCWCKEKLSTVWCGVSAFFRWIAAPVLVAAKFEFGVRSSVPCRFSHGLQVLRQLLD